MFIKKIELENIKIYEKYSVEFTSGVNFISGKNGAGKTTLIESIGYALFNAQVGGANFSTYLVRKGCNKGHIRLTFLDKDNNELISDRKIYTTGTGNTWSIRRIENGDEIEVISGIREVPAYLKDALGFSYDDDMSQIYDKILSVPQGEMTSAFFMNPSQRKIEFDPIFKLDSFRKASEKIKLNKELEKENNNIQNDISKFQGMISTYDDLALDNEKLSKDLKDKTEKLDKFVKEAENIKKEYEEVEKLKKDITEKENDIKLKQTELDKFNALRDKYNKDLEDVNKAVLLLNENEKAYNDYLVKEKELDEAESLLKKYEQSKKESDEQMKRIENGNTKISMKNEAIDKAAKLLEELKTKFEKSNNCVKELEKKFNSFGDIKQDTKIDIETIRKANNSIIELDVKVKSLESEIKKALLKTGNNEIIFLNNANKNIDDIIKIADEEIKTLASCAKTNIERAIDINKNSGTQDESLALIQDKEALLRKIDEIFNVNVKDDLILDEYNQDNSKAKELFNKYLSMCEKANNPNADFIKCEVELKQAKKENDELSKKIKEDEELLKQDIAEKEKWINGIANIQKTIDSLKDDVKHYDDEAKHIEEIKKSMVSLKEPYNLYVQNIKKKDELNGIKNSIKELDEKEKTEKDKFDTIKKEYDVLINKFDEEDYNKKKASFDDYNISYKLLEQDIESTKQNIDKNSKTLKEFDAIKVQIKDKEILMNDNQEAIELIKKLKQVINEAPEKISDMLIKDISKKAAEYYSEISSDSNRLEWENTYELFLYDYLNDKEVKKEFRQLSGGEQMSAALAIRIAMLLKLTTLKIGVLDEPTTNIDNIRREKIAQIISRTSEKFNQLFVVSHDDTFENITQNVITLTGGKD